MNFLFTQPVLNVVAASVFFLIAWYVCSKFLFGPYIELLSEREDRTSGDESLIRKKKVELQDLLLELERELLSAKTHGSRDKEKRINEAKDLAQGIVEKATSEAKAEVEQARLELLKIQESCVAELSGEAMKLSESLVDKVSSFGGQRSVH